MLRLLLLLSFAITAPVIHALLPAPKAQGYAAGIQSLLAKGDRLAAQALIDDMASHYDKFERDTVFSSIMNQGGRLAYEDADFTKALNYFRLGRMSSVANGNRRAGISCTGNIGVIFESIGDYGSALYYCDKALAEAEANGFDDLAWNNAANLVSIACQLGDTDKAIVYARHNQKLSPDTLTPLQRYLLLKNDFVIADKRNEIRRLPAIAAKILHVTDSAMLSPVYKVTALHYKALGWLKNGRPDSTLYYSQLVEQKAREAGMTGAFAEVTGYLANAYAAVGDTVNENVCRRRAQAYADSLYDAKDFEAAKFAFLESEDTSMNNRLGDLRRVIRWQTSALVAVGIGVLAIIVLGVIVFRSRRNRKELTLFLYRQVSRMADTEGTSAPDGGENQVETEELDHTSLPMSSMMAERLLADITDALAKPENTSDPDFSLGTLARIVGSNTKYCSRIINQKMKCNFKTLVNEKRVLEACRVIHSDEGAQLQEIGERVGFRSVSTFYSSFKTVTGMTPAEYRKLDRSQRRTFRDTELPSE